jgi:hypothetical protein
MVITNDLLLGLLGGIGLTLIIQQLMKVSSRLLRPGCLILIGLLVVSFLILVFAGVINFQLFS